MIRAGVRWRPGNVSSGGLHLHHMLVGGAGGFSSADNYSPAAGIFAAAFGCGTALVLDEFALILHLKDVYWSERGRISVDAVFLAAALIGLLLLGVTPFGVAGNGSQPRTAWAYPLAPARHPAQRGARRHHLAEGQGVDRAARHPGAGAGTGGRDPAGPAGVTVGALAVPARIAQGGAGPRREDRQHARWQRWRHRVQDAVAGKPT
jgi:hypothetical protein